MPHVLPRLARLAPAAGLVLLAAACATGSEAASTPPRASSTAPAPAATQPCEGMDVTLGETKISIARDFTATPVPHAGGTVDRAALEAALRGCAAGGGGMLHVTAERPYQDVVTVMDVFIAHGLDLALARTALPGLAQQPMLPEPPMPAPGASGGALATAPVLVITGGAAGTITLSGTSASPLALAARPALDDAAARALYDALVAFRGAHAGAGVVIVQADASTPSSAVVRAAGAAAAAGFHVLFAVKDR